MDKRIPMIVAVSLLLASFLLQPGTTATMSSPSRTVEVIPISLSESYQLAEKQISITVQGMACVTAAGDAYLSISIAVDEQDTGSSKIVTTKTSLTASIPEFVKYRDAVAAFNRGETDSPVPQATEQSSTKDVYTGPKYWWYGIKFVAAGDPQYYIDFSHPDNYDTYYPFQWNTNWVVTSVQSGWKKWAHHTASSTMQQAVATANLALAVSSMAATIGFAAGVIAGLILAMLAIAVLGVWAFLYYIMQSEWLDGWSYTHDNLSNHNRLISFGAWRDWGWYLGQW